MELCKLAAADRMTNRPENSAPSLDIFPWNEHFPTGLPEIDKQHRRLVDLLNRLAGQVAYGGATKELNDILGELKDYTVYHFETEEGVWAKHLPGDPDEMHHRKVHGNFIEAIERIEAERSFKSTDQLIQDTLGFLARWLASHILETDKRMAFVVQGIQAGLDTETAKQQADRKMSGETRSLINIILSIYETLAKNAVQLMREIAAHKEANDALRISERRYHASIEVSPIPMAINDGHGNILYLNPAFTRTFGYTLSDIPTLQDWWRLAHPDPDYCRRVVSAWQAHLDKARKNSTGFEPLEVVLQSKTGDQRTALATASQLDEGVDGHHLVTLYDITDRKKSELQLRDSEVRFRALVEASAQIVWQCAPDGSVVEDSPSWRLYTGQTYDEWSGTGYVEAIHPDDRELAIERWQRALAEEWPSMTNVYRLRHVSGEWRWNKATAVPIRDETGTLTSWVGTCSDIHEFQLNQLELAMHREHLEKLVETRTADLEIAKEAAEAASRAKTAFLSIASHELRTPMNGVMGTIALAMRKTADPQVQDYLVRADRASKHLLTVINDVLDISRIESNRLVLAETDFTLSEVKLHVLDVVESLLQEKQLALEFQLADELGNKRWIGDPTRLSQILINLLGNAVKFTQQGSITVRISDLSPSGRAGIRFEVQDTGIGIRPEDQSRIFEPFVQVDDSIARRHGGTGLGLALCQRLVHAMGGSIGLDSEPGKGSLFWFELAFEEGGGSSEPLAADQEAPGDVLLARHPGATVLLVEDEPISQEVVREMLEFVGLSVFVANDGVEAVENAATARFDLILMDMQMPRMDGIEATYQIRNLEAHSQTPIIALTANAFSDDKNHCIQAGMNDHLSKPVIPEVLYEKVLRWLEHGVRSSPPVRASS